MCRSLFFNSITPLSSDLVCSVLSVVDSSNDPESSDPESSDHESSDPDRSSEFFVVVVIIYGSNL